MAGTTKTILFHIGNALLLMQSCSGIINLSPTLTSSPVADDAVVDLAEARLAVEARLAIEGQWIRNVN